MDRCEDFKKIFKDIKLDEKFVKYLIDNGFFTQAASTKYHGVYAGGLYDHSKNVMEELVNLTIKLDLKWERKESPYIIGMFHDLCKIDNYTLEKDGSYSYNKDKKSLGHGSRSVLLLEEYMDLTEEEKLCITYHMGAYETSNWNEFEKAIRKYENVLWTHTADMYASKIVEK